MTTEDPAPPPPEEKIVAGTRGLPRLLAAVERLLGSADRPNVPARVPEAVSTAVRDIPGMSAGLPAEIVEKYEIRERLGGGGTAAVFRAVDRRTGQEVALKVLRDYMAYDDQARRRFVREAKAVASLSHPNVCGLYGLDETTDGQLVIVMPCYDGETLRSKMDRGPLEVSEALDYAAQAAEGLAHAHAAAIVHRDIKPANLVVTSAGCVKILDFGMARLDNVRMTRSGAVIGTFNYMSPEQARGRRVDHRSDLWSLGIVLYEMLAGAPAFPGGSIRALMLSIHNAKPAPLATRRADVPPGLQGVLDGLIAERAEARFPTADTAAARLRELLG